MTPKEITRLREKLKLTQQQLADAIGSQRHTVSRWENGENVPRGANLKALQELQKKTKVLEAKAKIFDRLCSQYHKDGSKNAYVDRQIVKKDKAIPDDIFGKALNEFISEGYTRVEVEHPSGRLRLGDHGLRSCESKKNPYR